MPLQPASTLLLPISLSDMVAAVAVDGGRRQVQVACTLGGDQVENCDCHAKARLSLSRPLLWLSAAWNHRPWTTGRYSDLTSQNATRGKRERICAVR